MAYKNAFNCKKCPQSNGENGCPAWWEFMAMDIASGREELKKMCGWQAMPIFMTEVIKASNRPAAAVESTRNEIAKGFANINTTIMHTNKQLSDAADKLLENKNAGDNNG